MQLSGHVLSSAAQLVTMLPSSAWNLQAKHLSQCHLLGCLQCRTLQTQALPTLSDMKLFYLGSSVCKRNISSKYRSWFGCAALVGASSSETFQSKDRDHSPRKNWIFMVRTCKKEKQNWVTLRGPHGKQRCCFYSQTRDTNARRKHSTFSLFYSLAPCFLQQVSLSSTLKHKSNQPCCWVKFNGVAWNGVRMNTFQLRSKCQAVIRLGRRRSVPSTYFRIALIYWDVQKKRFWILASLSLEEVIPC